MTPTPKGDMILNAMSAAVDAGIAVVSAPPATVTALVDSIVPAVVFHHSSLLPPFAKPVALRLLPEKVPVIQPKVI